MRLYLILIVLIFGSCREKQNNNDSKKVSSLVIKADNLSCISYNNIDSLISDLNVKPWKRDNKNRVYFNNKELYADLFAVSSDSVRLISVPKINKDSINFYLHKLEYLGRKTNFKFDFDSILGKPLGRFPYSKIQERSFLFYQNDSSYMTMIDIGPNWKKIERRKALIDKLKKLIQCDFIVCDKSKPCYLNKITP